MNNEVKLSSLCNEVKVKPSVCRHHTGRVILLVVMQFGIWWRKIDVRCFLSISPGVVLLHQTIIRPPHPPIRQGLEPGQLKSLRPGDTNINSASPEPFYSSAGWLTYLTPTHTNTSKAHTYTHTQAHTWTQNSRQTHKPQAAYNMNNKPIPASTWTANQYSHPSLALQV